MQYRQLSSIYYTNKKQYEEVYRQRINGETAIVLDFQTVEGPAFIVCTPYILKLVTDIYKLNTRIFDNCRLLPNDAIGQFARKSIIDEIMLTLEIENVRSTKKEIRIAMKPGKKEKSTRLKGMASKYQMLMNKNDISLSTSSDIRILYDEICLPEVLEEDPACMPDGDVFRKDPVYVFGKGTQKIHKGLFPENTVIQAMEKALTIMHDERIELLLRIAAFHYMFGYIHPFYDGNGRMARFISSYMLSKIHPLIAVRLSYTIKTNISKYYRMFKDANKKYNRGDITPFVVSFLEIILESYENLDIALTERIRGMAYYADITREVWTKKYDKNWQEIAFLLLQVTLFGDSGISVSEITQNCRYSRSTVINTLKDPKYTPYLVVDRSSRSHLYVLNLDSLEEHAASFGFEKDDS